MSWRLIAACCGLAWCQAAPAAQPGATLKSVRAAGVLKCGINRAEADYSKDDTHGNLAALSADVCKAVAVAALGPGAGFVIKGYGDEPHALRALRDREVDIVAGASPSPRNRAAFALGFGPAVFNDGQGFLVRNASGVQKLEDFAGKQICFIAGTEADFTLSTVLRARHIAYLPFPFEEQGEMEAALFTGHCAAITGDISRLADTLYGFRSGSNRYRIAAERINDDPWAPAYRLDDAWWGTIVDRTIDGLMCADAAGLTAASLQRSANPALPNGSVTTLEKIAAPPPPGLDDAWLANVLSAVGNYGEIFERDVGAGSPLRLVRREPTATAACGPVR